VKAAIMDYSKSFAISAAGMAAERLRVEVSVLNIANANTIQTAGSGGYQPLRVVLRSTTAASAMPGAFAARMEAGRNEVLNTLPEASVEPSGVVPRQVYEPGNPFADTKGFVSYPGVDTATEMVNMMSALRSYESNVAALNMAKTLSSKALEIGGASS
jgi:flagellar basal-body rod protein FlgC